MCVQSVLRKERAGVTAWKVREGCAEVTLEQGFRQDQLTPCFLEDEGHPRWTAEHTNTSEIRRFAGCSPQLHLCLFFFLSSSLFPSCHLSGFLSSRGFFFLLESLINFRSACSESWQRCVSHLNKCLRCYFLDLKNKLFLKKVKLVGTQQGQFLWPVLKKRALQMSTVTKGGRTWGPGNAFP